MLVTLLRFSNVLGDHMDTPFVRALRMPVVPEILGFDPRLQFTHEDDVVDALTHAHASTTCPGIYNVAGDGVDHRGARCAAWSASAASALPPVLTELRGGAAAPHAVVDLPPRCWPCCATAAASTTAGSSGPASATATRTAGTVDAFARSLRLERAVGDSQPEYRYQQDVETFFRHSPAVVRD